MPGFVVKCSSEEEVKLKHFLNENNLMYEDVKLHDRKRRLKDKKNEIQSELNRVGEKYLRICQNELRTVPAYITLVIEKEKFIMLVYNEEGIRMDLKEHGEVARLKSIWLHILKKYVQSIRKSGLSELIWEFKIDNSILLDTKNDNQNNISVVS